MKQLKIKPGDLGFNWHEAYAECCAYGFKPISLDTDQELKCFAEFVHSKQK
jgi:hypothetical protein